MQWGTRFIFSWLPRPHVCSKGHWKRKTERMIQRVRERVSTLIIQWVVLQKQSKLLTIFEIASLSIFSNICWPTFTPVVAYFGKLGHECIHHIYEYSKVLQFAIRQSRQTKQQQQHQWEVIGSAFETQWKHLRKYTCIIHIKKDNQIWIQLRSHKTKHCDPYSGP